VAVGVGTGLAAAGLVLLSVSPVLYYQAPSEPTVTLYERDGRDSSTLIYVGLPTLLLGSLFLVFSGPRLADILAKERELKRETANPLQTRLWPNPMGSGMALEWRF
jgi:hypothetical protein